VGSSTAAGVGPDAAVPGTAAWLRLNFCCWLNGSSTVAYGAAHAATGSH
jgi:hypothetical protein